MISAISRNGARLSCGEIDPFWLVRLRQSCAGRAGEREEAFHSRRFRLHPYLQQQDEMDRADDEARIENRRREGEPEELFGRARQIEQRTERRNRGAYGPSTL
jgi:hypothetical protein